MILWNVEGWGTTSALPNEGKSCGLDCLISARGRLQKQYYFDLMYVPMLKSASSCRNKKENGRGLVFIKFNLALLASGRASSQAQRDQGLQSQVSATEFSLCLVQWRYLTRTWLGNDTSSEGSVVLSPEEPQHITQLHLLKLNNFITVFFYIELTFSQSLG